jgi:hypothetical protein
LKIVGVISDHKEAENIEDIVKVFVVKKRISDIISDKKGKDIDDIETNSMMLTSDNINKLKNPHEDAFPQKEENNHKPLFNVRGLN